MGKATVRLAAIAVTAAAAGATAAVLRAGRRTPESRPAGSGGERVTERGVTIYQPPDTVYRFCRDLTRLGAALDSRAQVTDMGEHRSMWQVGEATWSVEITADEPEKVLAWRVSEGPLPHEGQLEFAPAPADRGTEVRANLRYERAGGALATAVAKASGDEPDQWLRGALRRVKQMLECGEVVTVTGQPTGRGPVQERVTRMLQQRLAAGGRP